MGIRISGFISAQAAQANYLLDAPSRDNTSILVDCGYVTTAVAFIRGDGLIHLDSIPFGGAFIFNSLMEELGIRDYEIALALINSVNLNLECGENDNYIVGKHAYRAKRTNEVILAEIKQIANKIAACGASCPHYIPKGVRFFLTGGTIHHIKGGSHYLGQYVGKEFNLVKSHDIKLRHPEYSSAYSVMNEALKMNRTRKG
jgi:cell division ATPase FtsA